MEFWEGKIVEAVSARGKLEERLADLLLGNKVRCFTKVELLTDPVRWQILFSLLVLLFFFLSFFAVQLSFPSP